MPGVHTAPPAQIRRSRSILGADAARVLSLSAGHPGTIPYTSGVTKLFEFDATLTAEQRKLFEKLHFFVATPEAAADADISPPPGAAGKQRFYKEGNAVATSAEVVLLATLVFVHFEGKKRGELDAWLDEVAKDQARMDELGDFWRPVGNSSLFSPKVRALSRQNNPPFATVKAPAAADRPLPEFPDFPKLSSSLPLCLSSSACPSAACPQNDLMLAYDAAVRVYLSTHHGGRGVIETASMLLANWPGGGRSKLATPCAIGTYLRQLQPKTKGGKATLFGSKYDAKSPGSARHVASIPAVAALLRDRTWRGAIRKLFYEHEVVVECPLKLSLADAYDLVDAAEEVVEQCKVAMELKQAKLTAAHKLVSRHKFLAEQAKEKEQKAAKTKFAKVLKVVKAAAKKDKKSAVSKAVKKALKKQAKSLSAKAKVAAVAAADDTLRAEATRQQGLATKAHKLKRKFKSQLKYWKGMAETRLDLNGKLRDKLMEEAAEDELDDENDDEGAQQQQQL